MLDHTHKPDRRSWLASACAAGTDFPLQNLPFGVFSVGDGPRRGGVAIGASILDIGAALAAGLFDDDIADVAALAAQPSLNALISGGNGPAVRLRHALFEILAEGGSKAAQAQAIADTVLVPLGDAQLHLPVTIPNFTDFMTSVYHISSARSARPARPVAENFYHLPIAYHSRATTVTVDGVDFERPWGQSKQGDAVVFSPTRQLDFELEFGVLVGKPTQLGQPVGVDQAEDHLFGYLLVNDWSARDIQLWESRLGPFLGKSFRTSVSPWIVTAAALAPFRTPAPARPEGLPQPLPHLDSAWHRDHGGLEVHLDAHLSTSAMRSSGTAPARIVTTQLSHCAWTFAQMLAHHTSNGCNLESGDLLSSGTVSGPEDENAACLFERTAGTLPLDLPGGEQRLWLEDGDELVITARASRPGFVPIGFGTCGATVLPALASIT